LLSITLQFLIFFKARAPRIDRTRYRAVSCCLGRRRHEADLGPRGASASAKDGVEILPAAQDVRLETGVTMA